MRKVKLTSEWIGSWRPSRQEEIADGLCRGLLLRGGPSGAKSFYRWISIVDPRTGQSKRKRLVLGRWSMDGGRGTISLKQARDTLLGAQEARREELSGTTAITVQRLFEDYRRDVLSALRPPGPEKTWRIVESHILHAVPSPKRAPFGEWPAREVTASDIASVVRLARAERREFRHRGAGSARPMKIGGPNVAIRVLKLLKAAFAHGVGSGSIGATPAAVMRAASLGLHTTPRARWLNASELASFFEAIDLEGLLLGSPRTMRVAPVTRLGLALLLYVPVRSHSLIGATWKEIDLETGRWTLPPDRLKLGRVARATARAFTVPLPETAVKILQRLRDLEGDPWVLPAPADRRKHIHANVLHHTLANLHRSGLLPCAAVSPHDLRRTWRTWAGELGVTYEVAEKSLHHALPGIVDVYARSDLFHQRAAASELVASAFDRIRLGHQAQVVPMAERTVRASK